MQDRFMCCVNTALWYNNVNCEPQTKSNTSLIEHFGKECTLYNPDRHSINKLGLLIRIFNRKFKW
jgi:hypothetical protein